MLDACNVSRKNRHLSTYTALLTLYRMRPGERNLITDVAGLRVGNSNDDILKSGVTALVADVQNVSSVHVMGGAPGTRETDLLHVESITNSINAFILSGGSAFGLDAASGAQAALREQGKGLNLGPHCIPIVPAAILFDLTNGGDKNWGKYSPYRDLGFEAVQNADTHFEIGSFGAGVGALTGGPGKGLKGGLGSASTVLDNGITVGVLVAINALGAPTVGDGANFWAAPFEMNNEFGGLGVSSAQPLEASKMRLKNNDIQPPSNANTTLAIIATDAKLTKADAKRLAISAHDGFARALWPSHTPVDGDIIFSISTGAVEAPRTLDFAVELSAVAASTMSRAIARATYSARKADGDVLPTWQDHFS